MSSAEPLPIDPFCSAADPSRYVPRAAIEAALSELAAALDAGPGAIAFTGPIGIGKSMAVRVLEARLAHAYTFVCLQATPPTLEQVCEAALLALGDEPPGDACGALSLRAALLARRGRPLVLVLDAAEALAPDLLAGLCELPLGELRVVLVVSERQGLESGLGAFGDELRRVALEAPLSRAENEEYLEARLEHADAPPDLRERVLARALDLWRASRGNPQLLHAEVSQLQLELWRATAAEPQLSLVEAEPEPPDAQLAGLEDLEIDADVGPVPEIPEPVEPVAAQPIAEPSPQPAAIAESVAAPEIPEPPASLPPESATHSPTVVRRRSRGWVFALGALTGSVLTAAALTWIRPERDAIPRAAQPPAARSASTAPIAEPTPPPPVSAAPIAAPAEPIAPPPAPGTPRPDPEGKSSGSETPREAGSATPAAREAPAAPPPERGGTVRVHVQALPWATIYVDGKRVGETPLGDLPVGRGVREFRAEMADGRTLTRRVPVEDGTRVLFQ